MPLKERIQQIYMRLTRDTETDEEADRSLDELGDEDIYACVTTVDGQPIATDDDHGRAPELTTGEQPGLIDEPVPDEHERSQSEPPTGLDDLREAYAERYRESHNTFDVALVHNTDDDDGEDDDDDDRTERDWTPIENPTYARYNITADRYTRAYGPSSNGEVWSTTSTDNSYDASTIDDTLITEAVIEDIRSYNPNSTDTDE